MSLSWSDEYTLPQLPAKPEPAQPYCHFLDWERLGPGSSWMEYRRVVSEMRRRGEEDAARIAELEEQLDRAQRYSEFVTLNHRGETHIGLATALLDATPAATPAAPLPGTQRAQRHAHHGQIPPADPPASDGRWRGWDGEDGKGRKRRSGVRLCGGLAWAPRAVLVLLACAGLWAVFGGLFWGLYALGFR